MDAHVIKNAVETAWQEASSRWKDEYAARYRTAVIAELENALQRLGSTSAKLDEAIESTLSSLREFLD